jgi:hypothetical protein
MQSTYDVYSKLTKYTINDQKRQNQLMKLLEERKPDQIPYDISYNGGRYSEFDCCVSLNKNGSLKIEGSSKPTRYGIFLIDGSYINIKYLEGSGDTAESDLIIEEKIPITPGKNEINYQDKILRPYEDYFYPLRRLDLDEENLKIVFKLLDEVRIPKLTKDSEYIFGKIEREGEAYITTYYILELFSNGTFKLQFISGSDDTNCTSYISFGIFDDNQEEIKLTYTTFGQKGFPKESIVSTGVIKRIGENMVWNDIILTPLGNPKEITQVLTDVLGFGAQYIKCSETPIYLGHILLAQNAVPSNFQGSFKSESRGGHDGWGLWSEEFDFYPNGMFKSHKCEAGHDFSLDKKMFGNYIKRDNEFEILCSSYNSNVGIEILPQRFILPYADGEIVSQNKIRCKQL